MNTRKCYSCAILQLEVRLVGDQSFYALIMTYYATHGSVQIVCSSSSAPTIASLLVELPS